MAYRTKLAHQALFAAVEQEVQKRTDALRLIARHGPITALAYVLIIGTPERFHLCKQKQIGTYLG